MTLSCLVYFVYLSCATWMLSGTKTWQYSSLKKSEIYYRCGKNCPESKTREVTLSADFNCLPHLTLSTPPAILGSRVPYNSTWTASGMSPFRGGMMMGARYKLSMLQGPPWHLANIQSRWNYLPEVVLNPGVLSNIPQDESLDLQMVLPNVFALVEGLLKRLFESQADVICTHNVHDISKPPRNSGWQRSHVWALGT
jgi:hypothetical protein